MAFMRYANASVVQPSVSQKGWTKVRKAAVNTPRNLVVQASEILGKPFNPDEYLLTHCTIVASVDVDTVPNVKLGRVKVGSKTINRKFVDYYIKPLSTKFVNNNGDSWSRDVLLASYPTFIGAHNFLEHVQIEEQSKGRIIDAVARDIGDSIYIDILVATDRRHTQLVKDIESSKMGTLSMGCSVEETICTKCGNVAVDETDLCEHIKYEKLNTFYDDQGNKRVVAELCGHKDLGGNCGVTFIEASWVSTPAFTGAVLNKILEPAKMTPELARHIQAVLGTVPPEWGGGGQQKAATQVSAQNPRTVVTAAGWDFKDEDGEDKAEAESDGETKDEPKTKDQPIDKLVDDVYDAVRTRVKDRVDDDLRKKKDEKALSPESSSAWTNDTLVKEGARVVFRKLSARHYKASVQALLHTATADINFIEGLAVLNNSFGIELSRDLYRTALRVGSTTNHETVGHYLEACRTASGRLFTPAESRALVRIGNLLTRLGSI